MLAAVRRRPGPAPADAHAGQGGLDNAANRRMCAGTYLDREFRGQVLRGVYNDRNRRVAPSYGFDLALVVHHAWRAWWLEFCQQLAVLAVFGFAAAFAALNTVIAISVLTIWQVLRQVPGWARGLPAYCTGRAAGAEIQQLRARSKLLGAWLLGASVTLLAAMVTAFAASGRAGTSREGWPERAGLTGAGAILAVLAFVVTAAAVLRLAWSGRLRRADPRPARMPGRRIRAIAGQQHHQPPQAGSSTAACGGEPAGLPAPHRRAVQASPECWPGLSPAHCLNELNCPGVPEALGPATGETSPPRAHQHGGVVLYLARLVS